jgi:hypothetical protein
MAVIIAAIPITAKGTPTPISTFSPVASDELVLATKLEVDEDIVANVLVISLPGVRID